MLPAPRECWRESARGGGRRGKGGERGQTNKEKEGLAPLTSANGGVKLLLVLEGFLDVLTIHQLDIQIAVFVEVDQFEVRKVIVDV